MLPSVLATQLKQGLIDYMRTTFPMTNEPFRGSFDGFIDGSALCQAPFVSAKLPFRHAPDDVLWPFEAIERKYAPYCHQQRAFDRLACAEPRSTIVATGTGSGKTECFLYPVLDYCYKRRTLHNETGVKAIIIYPMNALASDQARRFAELVHASQKLRDVKVGMYVGGTAKDAAEEMGEKSVITNHAKLRENPPDVLLTNYKMLDYLLVRPEDAELWTGCGGDTLKFLVVDELHTFDGAQGTDLACLIRRLKARLGIPKNSLCCVGTSATIGAGELSDKVLDYARGVFGEPFDPDAVVTEDRLAPDDFFRGCVPFIDSMPTADQIDQLAELAVGEDVGAYLRAAVDAWIPAVLQDSVGGDDLFSDDMRVLVGEALKSSRFFHSLVRSLDDRPQSFPALAKTLVDVFPRLASLNITGEDALAKTRRDSVFASVFALVSHARARVDPDKPAAPGNLCPFLNVQVQFWLKELRRLVATIPAGNGSKPTYALARDLNDSALGQRLPVLNCRDCGRAAWGTVGGGNLENAACRDLDVFYTKYFEASETVKLFYPGVDPDGEAPNFAEHSRPANLCGTSMALDFGKPGGVDEISLKPALRVRVVAPKPATIRVKGKTIKKGFVCPYCGSQHGLSIVGIQSASEISASLSQILSSRFNGDRKALAFSDNVQDAAHRAAFFSARSWRFSFRSAIQEFVRACTAAESKTLDVFIRDFFCYWKEKSLEDFVGILIPHDLLWLRDFENSVKADKLIASAEKNLIPILEKRLRFEIYHEFGLTAHVGRTLEKSGCSVLAFDNDDVRAIAKKLRDYAVDALGFKSVAGNSRIAQLKINSELRVFQRLVFRFLDITRRNGAFVDEIYRPFLNADCNDFLLTPDRNSGIRLWAPSVGMHKRNVPRFLVEPDASGLTKEAAEYARYPHSPEYLAAAKRILSEFADAQLFDARDALMKKLFEAAVEQGLLVLAGESEKGKVKKAVKYYGLNPSKLRVSNDVCRIVCNSCGDSRAVAWENHEFAEDAPCLAKACRGVDVLDKERCNSRHDALELDGDALDYYGRLYRRGETTRIVASEHTGLLQRDAREKLEEKFKASAEKRKPWTPNVLSCTPTLEMGVDIGDLSTVVMCGTPPGQSEFLQRCGRAGRKDGNALVAVVAAAKPRDLYYYADPSKMLDGAVEPPRVFLSAAAVLERQFVAFCMDSWVLEGAASIPSNVGRVLAKMTHGRVAATPPDAAETAAEPVETGARCDFPENFYNFIRERKNRLCNDFISIFDDVVDDQAKDSIRKFALGSFAPCSDDTDDADCLASFLEKSELPVVTRIADAFDALLKERDSFKKTVEELKAKIEEIESRKATDKSWEEEVRNIKAEIAAFRAVLREIRLKNVFNFLSDEGVLPNYAFPEAGVVLRAIITRKSVAADKSGEQDVAPDAAVGSAIAANTGITHGPVPRNLLARRSSTRYEQTKLEFMRAAASAITEFAPNNTFYAEGRRFVVDQIDVKTAEPTKWRLCPTCSHMEQEAGVTDRNACPVCHDRRWADVGQIRTMLRVQTVYSNVDYRDSILDDAAETRSANAYCKQLLVNFASDYIESAYEVDTKSFEFGFEFVTKATLREINFGEKDIFGDKMFVAGFEQVRKGFRICPECGKIQNGNSEKNHTYLCPARKNPNVMKADEKCLFLYREFETEILRVLIPATAESPNSTVRDSFAAAFMLGLNRKFGTVSHLRCAFADVVLPGSEHRRQVLVLYDSVPGGTGYLKQLAADPQEIFDVFQKAFDALKECDCANENPPRDGCYRCIFPHNVGGKNPGNLARSTALSLLAPLLNERGTVKKVRSIDEMQIERLVDSELESMFLNALRERAGDSWGRCRHYFAGKDYPAFRFTFGKQAWDIIPQPEVACTLRSDPRVASKPDFLMIPVRCSNRRPVVVFTDGFEYHRKIVAEDVAKREELRRHGFVVWSLTYDDVKAASAPDSVNASVKVFDEERYPSKKLFDKILGDKKAGIADERLKTIKPALNNGAFFFLVDFLAHDQAEDEYGKVANAYAKALVSGLSDDDRMVWKKRWQEFKEANLLVDAAENCRYAGLWSPADDGSLLHVGVGADKITITSDVGVFALLDDAESDLADERYKPSWNAFWTFTNLMQFVKSFSFASKTAFENDRIDRLANYQPDDALRICELDDNMFREVDQNDSWAVCACCIVKGSLEELCFNRIRELGLAVPCVGEDVVNDDEEVVASPNFYWPDDRLALFCDDIDARKKDVENLVKLGCRVITLMTPEDVEKLDEKTLRGE